MHRLGRVAHFVRNPALSTDQPLRGSWWYSNSFLSNLSQNASYLIPNSPLKMHKAQTGDVKVYAISLTHSKPLQTVRYSELAPIWMKSIVLTVC